MPYAANLEADGLAETSRYRFRGQKDFVSRRLIILFVENLLLCTCKHLRDIYLKYNLIKASSSRHRSRLRLYYCVFCTSSSNTSLLQGTNFLKFFKKFISNNEERDQTTTTTTPTKRLSPKFATVVGKKRSNLSFHDDDCQLLEQEKEER